MDNIYSLTSDGDLIITKIDNCYLCLAHPSKRRCKLNWHEAKEYCKSLGRGYVLPNCKDAALLCRTKEDLILVEKILYEERLTLDFIGTWTNTFRNNSCIWLDSSECGEAGMAFAKSLSEGDSFCNYFCNKRLDTNWVIPVKRVKSVRITITN